MVTGVSSVGSLLAVVVDCSAPGHAPHEAVLSTANAVRARATPGRSRVGARPARMAAVVPTRARTDSGTMTRPPCARSHSRFGGLSGSGDVEGEVVEVRVA